MRKKLGELNNQRLRFKAKFIRFGFKNAYRGPDLVTLLLEDVSLFDDKEILSSHLWMNETKEIKSLNLQPGDYISFDARVTKYEKGYRGRREDVFKNPSWDYRLSYPTKIRRIND